MTRSAPPAPLQLGPADHGRPLSRAEYERASYQEGHRYELVAGRLHVGPMPNPRHTRVVRQVDRLLEAYRRDHSDVFNHVTPARIITRALGGETDPEPDLAAYRDYPLGCDPTTWEGIYPALVVEVVSPGDPDKDYERNRRLYWEVPSIEEYWIIDPRTGPPSLLALVRGPAGWVEHPVAPGGTYASPRFPGLVVDLTTIAPR